MSVRTSSPFLSKCLAFLYQKALLSMLVDRYSFPDGLSPTTSSSFRCMSSEIYLCELITQPRSAAACPAPSWLLGGFCPTPVQPSAVGTLNDYYREVASGIVHGDLPASSNIFGISPLLCLNVLHIFISRLPLPSFTEQDFHLNARLVSILNNLILFSSHHF